MHLLNSIKVGRAFTAIAAVEGETTRDGNYNRIIDPGALSFDGGPYPLLEGHDPNRVIGRVDRFGFLNDEPDDVQLRALLEGRLDGVDFERVVIAHGHFTDGQRAVEVADLVEGRFVTGVSVGAGRYDSTEDDDNREIRFSSFQIVELSVVPLPAIGSTSIWLNESEYTDIDPAPVVAAASPGVHPASAFQYRTVASRDLHRVTVEDGIFAGYVYLHNTPHLGLAWQTPPVEPAGFARFHNKSYRTSDNQTVETGVIVYRTEHADLTLGEQGTAAHYENTGQVAADVRLFDDGFGVLAIGPVRPGLTESQLNEFRGSEISGDWRSDTQGRLRLRVGLLVNLGGFPSDAEEAADVGALVFSSGRQQALVGNFATAPQQTAEPTADEVDDQLAADLAQLTNRMHALERKLCALTKVMQ